jgi:hypothetical protein
LALPAKKLFLSLYLKENTYMIKKYASIVVLLSLAFGTIAQSLESTKKTARPDIPGTFVMELGLNRLTEQPSGLKYGFWGSRTLNVYYQYDMRIGKSKFSFHPGVGFGMERLKLINFKQTYTFPAPSNKDTTITIPNPTLIYDAQGNTTFVNAARYIYDGDTLGQINWSGSYETKKSMLVMNFIDVPVEFRFSTNPDDPARSFKIGIGGRVGYLINAHTKIRYSEDGNIKKLKTHQDFNLNRFRYGAFLKVYMGNFSFFGYYNFNPLFETDKGPAKTKAQSYTIGISLSSF